MDDAVDVYDWFRAIDDENLYAIKEMMDKGIDPNIKNRMGYTALSDALYKNSNKFLHVDDFPVYYRDEKEYLTFPGEIFEIVNSYWFASGAELKKCLICNYSGNIYTNEIPFQLTINIDDEKTKLENDLISALEKIKLRKRLRIIKNDEIIIESFDDKTIRNLTIKASFSFGKPWILQTLENLDHSISEIDIVNEKVDIEYEDNGIIINKIIDYTDIVEEFTKNKNKFSIYYQNVKLMIIKDIFVYT